MKTAVIYDATQTDECKAIIRKAGMKVANVTDTATGFCYGRSVPAQVVRGMIKYALGEHKPADEQDILDIYGVIDGELVNLGVID